MISKTYKFLRFDGHNAVIGIRQQFLDNFEEMFYLKELTKHPVDGKRNNTILKTVFDIAKENEKIEGLDIGSF